MAKFRERILELKEKGCTAKKIQERLGCSISTVYRHLPKRPKKYNDEGLRWCWKCKQYLSPEKFNKDKNTKDGLQQMCKNCNSVEAKIRRLKAKDNITVAHWDIDAMMVTIEPKKRRGSKK